MYAFAHHVLNYVALFVLTAYAWAELFFAHPQTNSGDL